MQLPIPGFKGETNHSHMRRIQVAREHRVPGKGPGIPACESKVKGESEGENRDQVVSVPAWGRNNRKMAHGRKPAMRQECGKVMRTTHAEGV